MEIDVLSTASSKVLLFIYLGIVPAVPPRCLSIKGELRLSIVRFQFAPYLCWVRKFGLLMLLTRRRAAEMFPDLASECALRAGMGGRAFGKSDGLCAEIHSSMPLSAETESDL